MKASESLASDLSYLKLRNSFDPARFRAPKASELLLWPMAAITTLIVLPSNFLFVLPFALYTAIKRALFPARGMDDNILRSPEVKRLTQQLSPPPDKSNRPLDIVVMGATGLTGKMLLQYLTEIHSEMKVGLAGRSLKKLEAIRDELQIPPSSCEIIIADASNLESLFDMCKRTKVVASTAGPYKQLGNLVYHACAFTGTHYADITGEVDWVKHMGSLYEGVARKTGASLVSCCGFDSVPSEIGCFLSCKLFQEKFPGATPSNVEVCFDAPSGGALPGGTLNTFVGAADGLHKLQSPPDFLQPQVDQERRGTVKVARLFTPLLRSRATGRWSIPFVMAPINSATVRRSIARRGHISNVTYTERLSTGNLPANILALTLTYGIGGLWLVLPPLRNFLRAINVLPREDAGKTAVSLDRCFTGAVSLHASASGMVGGEEKHTVVRVKGLGDAGVAFTAACHGEVACLLANACKHSSGVAVETGAGLGPISAVGGEALFRSLVQSGFVKFEIVSSDGTKEISL